MRTSRLSGIITREQQGVQLKALLLREGIEVLEDLIVGGSGREHLFDLFLPEHQGRASADNRGEENVSVGDELHDASSATSRNPSALVYRALEFRVPDEVLVRDVTA